jgi:hypothetical protein
LLFQDWWNTNQGGKGTKQLRKEVINLAVFQSPMQIVQRNQQHHYLLDASCKNN